MNNVAGMVADVNLSIGDIVNTAGYLSEGDGGDNRYEIVAATGTVDGGLFIDLTGISGQAKGLFPGSIVNVKQFGAVGDGVTDDTVAIQAALYIGGKIYFPGGTYLHTGLSVASKGTVLRGDGATITILKYTIHTNFL